jgi:hypothetical protein
MRRAQRLIAAAILIALSGDLAGCSGGLGNFDPSDLLDWLDTKKKLPGDRKPVFPEGVPGLEQGVPKDLYKGAQQQQDQKNADAAAAAAAAPPPPAEEPKAKRGAKSKAKTNPNQPAAASTDQPAAETAPEEDATAAAPPPPKPKKIVRKRTTAPPPDQPTAQSGDPAQSAQQAPPFPAPVPSGTFTR